MRSTPDQGDDGVGAAILQVATDAKSYARAKVAVYRETAAARLRAAKLGIIVGSIAAALTFGALGALLVGLILALSPAIGAIWATVAVVAATLAIAGLLGWVAARQIAEALGPVE